MNKEFTRITILYTLAVAFIFYLIWAVLDFVLPEANINLLRALSTTFGINLPEDILVNAQMGFKAIAVVGVIALLSIGLIILNVLFGAIVTTHFIRPRIKLATSTRGVLSVKWNAIKPYVLVRLCNFHAADIVDVRITAALTVQETRSTPTGDDQFMTYLPIPVGEYTPPHVMILKRRTPWSIAVCADTLLSNTLTKEYHFKPGEPITKSFSSGKTAKNIKRTLEILIQGVDSKSYSDFSIHRSILIDEQDGDIYTLHLHRGTFKSLPLLIDSEKDLEQYQD